MIAGVEGNWILRPLEGFGRLNPGERDIDLARELLEAAVGLGSLSPAEDARCPARDLVAPRVLVREIVVLLDGVLLVKLERRS